jgi:hypothetical protein
MKLGITRVRKNVIVKNIWKNQKSMRLRKIKEHASLRNNNAKGLSWAAYLEDIEPV